jgi:fluoroquinolone resistance protein
MPVGAGRPWRPSSFHDCKLTGVQIADASTLGLTFENCLLVSARLHGLPFRRATLDGIDFQGADLTAVDFRETVLVRCERDRCPF